MFKLLLCFSNIKYMYYFPKKYNYTHIQYMVMVYLKVKGLLHSMRPSEATYEYTKTSVTVFLFFSQTSVFIVKQ